MAEGLPSCVICLEEPEEGNPLFLLACGCRVAWFHRSCEYAWVSQQHIFPYQCPTCRRITPMITNYSFSYWAGEDQKYLVHTLAACGAYTLYFTICSFTQYTHLYSLGLQEIAILTLPFILPSWNDLSYYLFHIRFHLLSTSFVYSLAFLGPVEKREPIYFYSVLVGYIHLSVLYIVFLHEWQNRPSFLIRQDPLNPYAISREVLHVDLITKAPPNTREGNKGTRTRALAARGKRRHRR